MKKKFTKKFIKEIINFHNQIPEKFNSEITLHTRNDTEYSLVASLIKELDLIQNFEYPLLIKTKLYWGVKFFAPQYQQDKAKQEGERNER